MPQAKKFATAIVQKLQDAGYIAYFAGGWVRDYLMQKTSHDIDIATDASVTEIQRLFPKTIPVGVAFGIVIVVEGEHQFEVATFRKDRGYEDGRRPTGIDPATPEEDASRRDFTINGLFFDPIAEKLYDFVDGEKDIKKKIIRAIGNPHDRFAEDRLRMMRAVRYATRFHFTIEENTRKAIKAHAQDLLPAVAMERVWQEFKKMSHFTHFDKGLILLHELGLLSTIFPSLKDISLHEIRNRVQFIEKFPPNSPTFAELLELFPDYDLDQALELADTLKLSNKEKAFAKFYLHAQALFRMPLDWLNQLEKIEWVTLYADPTSEMGLEMLAAKHPDQELFLKEHRERQRALAPHIERVRQNNPYLKAEHLMKEGILPGEKMGALLKEGMRIAVNKNIESPSLLIEKLKKTSLWPN